MPSEAPLVVARGISKSYASGEGTVQVLDRLDMDVRRGALVAIVGASGAGKSTLLHLLGGLDRPDAGSVEVDGRAIAGLDDRDLAAFRNRTVGFVFQFHHLLAEFDARENVAMPALLAGVPRARALARAGERLAEVGLAARFTHYPSQLSGGEQQRVAIARALVNDPPLLLADEPTGNLDPASAAAVFDVIARLHSERQLSAILVTHNPDLARRCHTVLTLSNSRLSETEPAIAR